MPPTTYTKIYHGRHRTRHKCPLSSPRNRGKHKDRRRYPSSCSPKESPTNMWHLVVNFACLAAVVLGGAHGQTFRHFGIGSGIDSFIHPPASAPMASSVISKERMIAQAADHQVALRTGACASDWTERFSAQCPAGSFMALKGYGTTMGLVPLFRCHPAGCMHAPTEDSYNLVSLLRVLAVTVGRCSLFPMQIPQHSAQLAAVIQYSTRRVGRERATMARRRVSVGS